MQKLHKSSLSAYQVVSELYNQITILFLSWKYTELEKSFRQTPFFREGWLISICDCAFASHFFVIRSCFVMATAVNNKNTTKVK